MIDPGYQTQGDMLVQALAARGLAPGDVRTVILTHLHSDHLSAVPQLGEVDLYVHERELETPYATRQRGLLDRATMRALSGDAGEILPGSRGSHAGPRPRPHRRRRRDRRRYRRGGG